MTDLLVFPFAPLRLCVKSLLAFPLRPCAFAFALNPSSPSLERFGQKVLLVACEVNVCVVLSLSGQRIQEALGRPVRIGFTRTGPARAIQPSDQREYIQRRKESVIVRIEVEANAIR